jgi:hypothetical protein
MSQNSKFNSEIIVKHKDDFSIWHNNFFLNCICYWKKDKCFDSDP